MTDRKGSSTLANYWLVTRPPDTFRRLGFSPLKVPGPYQSHFQRHSGGSSGECLEDIPAAATAAKESCETRRVVENAKRLYLGILRDTMVTKNLRSRICPRLSFRFLRTRWPHRNQQHSNVQRKLRPLVIRMPN